MAKRNVEAASDVKEIRTSDDLTLDPKNANLGTTRGLGLLDESLETCGAGRSISADKHGVVFAGNKTLLAARKLGIPIQVVQSDGHDLVVVQRTDLDLVEDPKARQLAYYDNRVRELDIAWSPEQLREDMMAGVDLNCAFFPDEIETLTKETVSAVASAVEQVPQIADPAVQDGAGDAPAAPDAGEVPAVDRGSAAQYVLTFDTIEQQLRWAAFSRRLREKYQDILTPGARLLAHMVSVDREAS